MVCGRHGCGRAVVAIVCGRHGLWPSLSNPIITTQSGPCWLERHTELVSIRKKRTVAVRLTGRSAGCSECTGGVWSNWYLVSSDVDSSPFWRWNASHRVHHRAPHRRRRALDFTQGQTNDKRTGRDRPVWRSKVRVQGHCREQDWGRKTRRTKCADSRQEPV